MTKKITKTREEPKAERPWIVSASQTEDGTGNVTIRFVDNTEIVKLGVSHEDYKAFEATFSQKDWQETSLAFLDNELSKYATAE